MIKQRLLSLIGLSLLSLILSTTLQAAPITYTFKGTLTGTLGAEILDETGYELVISSDTNTVAPSFALSTLVYNSGSAVISITGVGDSLFLDPLEVGMSTMNGVVGFLQDYFPCACDPSPDGITYKSGPGPLIGYDLTSSITDQPVTFFSSSVLPVSFALDTGLLTVTGVGSQGYFNAQVVPVPAAIWQFGTALLALAGLARRKGEETRRETA